MIKNFKKFLRKDINLYYKNSKFKSQNFQIPAAAIFKKIAAAFSITNCHSEHFLSVILSETKNPIHSKNPTVILSAIFIVILSILFSVILSASEESPE